MSIEKMYQLSKEKYAQIGVDTDKAITALENIIISLHCWQGDDVTGFENLDGGLTGGIAATGNYPGKARTPDELRADIEKAMSLIPCKQKVNVHALYSERGAYKADRDKLEPKHFQNWVDWAKAQKTGLDFNPSYFSHAKSADGFTLSHSDKSIRDFWIDHGKACRRISEYFGKETGYTSVMNIWIPDGYKDNPIDRLAPRVRLKEALDEMLKEKIDTKYHKDAVESKLFGIGSESYVVGSHEFYMGYAAQQDDVLLCLDAGHFHPTEVISAKISSLLLFVKELLLHVSRPVRWDSDHVVILDDELFAITQEIIRNNILDRVNIALDYFDASINRIAAWVIGTRNTQKALLRALLEPTDMLKKVELEGDLTSRLALTEELKAYPWQGVWDYFCEKNGVPQGEKWLAEVKQYEKDILSKR